MEYDWELLTYRGRVLGEANVYTLNSGSEPLEDGKEGHIADGKVDEEHCSNLVIGGFTRTSEENNTAECHGDGPWGRRGG